MPRTHRTVFHPPFPCLVRYGRRLEDPATATSDEEFHAINARNGFRHLTYGTSLFHGSLLAPVNRRLAWTHLRGLLWKRDPAMLHALRNELQHILLNACQKLTEGDIDEVRCQRFIYTLLANLPFLDPDNGTSIRVPQKVKNANNEMEWKGVDYTIRKIDISPRTGWRAALLTEEDRIYALGLEPDPEAEGAHPILLLMGTTYPAGQGFQLSLLADITPGTTVGEIHDRTLLNEWISQHKNIIVSGHSQGGTMAQLVAVESTILHSPARIAEAHCLNPTGIHRATLDRLNKHWNASDPATRPHINVYTQAGDPIYYFGDGFFKDTGVHFIEPGDSSQIAPYTSHSHHYMAHPFGLIREDVIYEADNRNLFVNNFKAVSDRILGPLWTLRFAWNGIRHKAVAFHDRHRTTLHTLSAYAFIIAGFALLASNVFLPLTFLTGLACVGASLLAANLLPPLIDVTLTVATYAISAVVTTLALATVFTLGALCAAVMTGFQTLFERHSPTRAGGSRLRQVTVEPSSRPLSSTAGIGKRVGFHEFHSTDDFHHPTKKSVLRRTKSNPNLFGHPQRSPKSPKNDTSDSTPVSGMAL